MMSRNWLNPIPVEQTCLLMDVVFKKWMKPVWNTPENTPSVARRSTRGRPNLEPEVTEDDRLMFVPHTFADACLFYENVLIPEVVTRMLAASMSTPLADAEEWWSAATAVSLDPWRELQSRMQAKT